MVTRSNTFVYTCQYIVSNTYTLVVIYCDWFYIVRGYHNLCCYILSIIPYAGINNYTYSSSLERIFYLIRCFWI